MIRAALPSPAQGIWHLGVVPIRAYALCILAGIFVAVADGLASFSLGTSGGDTVVTSGSDTIVVDLPYRVMTSYDGLTWTEREVPATYAWSCVAYGANGFIVLANGDGGGQQAMTSTDGLDRKSTRLNSSHT